MTEKLKTLKDFKYNPEDLGKYSIVSREWLKAEAIKRVKYHLKKPENDITYGRIEELKNFFNITSKDLK